MSCAARLGTLLAPGQVLRQVEPFIASVIQAEREGHAYDRSAGGYDRLIANGLYNRVAWGVPPSAHAATCGEALASSMSGAVLDAGCGTLVFTVGDYLRHTSRPLVLLDRSLGMLRRAKGRLLAGGATIPDHLALLQGDMTALPFEDGRFETVLSWGTLHLFDDPVPVLRELGRVMSPTGRLYFTSLVKGRFIGDRYLAILSRKGVTAAAMDVTALAARVAEAGLVPTMSVRGSVAFGSAGRPGPRRAG